MTDVKLNSNDSSLSNTSYIIINKDEQCHYHEDISLNSVDGNSILTSTYLKYGVINFIVICLLIFLIIFINYSNNSNNPACSGLCVSTPFGLIQGVELYDGMNPNTSYYAWKGIPFAKPPIGNLRWKPPQPINSWNDILDASAFSPICYQDSYIDAANYTQSEDCLYLNVYKPSNSNNNLTVMVWIYGGGFTAGAASLPFYNPQYLVNRDVLVVTINYRLGIFGFAASKLLATEDNNYPTSGNYGLLDQKLAMKWVKDNIAAFGGNPDKITLFGQSAGSMSICFHLLDSSISNLFNSVILESGPCNQKFNVSTNPFFSFSKPIVESFTSSFLAPYNCVDLACLRNIPAESLFVEQNNSGASLFVGPVIDNFIIIDPVPAFNSGNYTKVPMIIGNVANEGTIFLNQSMTIDQYQILIESSYPRFAQNIFSKYPLKDFSSPFYAASQIFGDSFFVCPSIRLAKLASKSESVFYYWFNHVPSFESGPTLAFHFSDVLFVFDSQYGFQNMTLDEMALSNTMMDYWTSFAKNNIPTSPNKSIWTRVNYDESSFSYMNLKTPNVQMNENIMKTICEFWDSLY